MTKPTLSPQEKTAQKLAQHVGGKWHWNAKKQLYFMEATPTLRHNAITIFGELNACQVPETDSGDLALAMTETNARDMLKKARNELYGIDKPNYLRSRLSEKNGPNWDREAKFVNFRDSVLKEQLAKFTGLQWVETDKGQSFLSQPINKTQAEQLIALFPTAEPVSEPNGQNKAAFTLTRADIQDGFAAMRDDLTAFKC